MKYPIKFLKTGGHGVIQQPLQMRTWIMSQIL